MFRKNIETAIAASFSIAFPLYFLLKWEEEHYQISNYVDWKVLGVLSLFPAAYLTAAILLWLGRKTLLVRKTPHWLAISFIGSTLFVIYLFFVIAPHRNTGANLSRVLSASAVMLIGFGVYTLPFTALAHYSDSIVAAIRRWHHGTHSVSSLFGKRRYF